MPDQGRKLSRPKAGTRRSKVTDTAACRVDKRRVSERYGAASDDPCAVSKTPSRWRQG